VIPALAVTTDERAAIRAFARGDKTSRAAALRSFHAFLARNRGQAPERWPLEMQFMSEIDSPSPDLALRAEYRRKLVESNGGE
jgi:hypothetical protein